MKLMPLLITCAQIGVATWLLVLAGTTLRRLWREYRASKDQQ